MTVTGGFWSISEGFCFKDFSFEVGYIENLILVVVVVSCFLILHVF